MSEDRKLEISGDLSAHYAAEIFAEIAQERLDGSLRLTSGDVKAIVYFRSGKLAFAVSNQRSSRLFDLLLRKGILTKDELAKIPDFANDHALAAHLRSTRTLTIDSANQYFAEQVYGIIVEVFKWETGTWTFSPLARARDGLDLKVDIQELMLNFARYTPKERVLERFSSFDETVRVDPERTAVMQMTPEEAFLLSRLGIEPTSLSDLVDVSMLSEVDLFCKLYELWLGGMIIRSGRRSAFPVEFINSLRRLKFDLKREAEIHSSTVPEVVDPKTEPAPVKPAMSAENVIGDKPPTLDEFLARVERSTTYYDVLGVDAKADTADIRRAYFSLAKVFHPDHYHNAEPALAKRVQNAFTEIAKAHETLRHESNREVYDFKVRKEIELQEKSKASGQTASVSLQLEQAEQSFDRGFNLLMDGEFEDALPLLARAVHYSPKNARYHAYYGKALASDDKQRHKAEAEMQAALKLDPHNANFRLMLAEFFINVGLVKRADGELTRLLAIFPSNREAQAMLDDLRAG
jgi:hypothetical protein